MVMWYLQLLQACEIDLSQLISGKRSVNGIKNKREVTIPEVKINQSLFKNLEEYFSSVALDELSSGMYIYIKLLVI